MTERGVRHENPKTLDLVGSVVPLITPRDEEGPLSIDIHGLRAVLEFHVLSNTDAIFILGTTGEFQRLTLEQKKLVIEQATGIVDSRVPVVVGVSAATTDEIAKLTRFSQEHRANGVVIAPLYGDKNQASNLLAVTESGDLPAILYNNPAIHGRVSLTPESVAIPDFDKLFAGIKDSSGDFAVFSSWLGLRSEHFRIFAGTYPLFVYGFNNGGIDGWVLAEANFLPQLFSQRSVTPDKKTVPPNVLELTSRVRILNANFIPITKQKVHGLGLISSPNLFPRPIYSLSP